MRVNQIILAMLIQLGGSQVGLGQPALIAPQPVARAASPYGDAGGVPAQFGPGRQSYALPGTVAAPTYPQASVLPGTVVVPPPVGVAAGGMSGPQFGVPADTPGVADLNYGTPAFAPTPPPQIQSLGPNPIVVPVTNEDFAWDQIADVVSGYFTIAREQRARREGELVTEGRIDTVPQTGATWLEPYRKDSVGSFNRWESTFQSIRRRATVRVIPDAAGYLVELIVEKELEDLPQPEKATAGAVVFRGDDSLPSQRLEDVNRVRSSPRWLQLGRDPLLEQRMLGDIQARLGGPRAR
jgi:hypothetical protein